MDRVAEIPLPRLMSPTRQELGRLHPTKEGNALQINGRSSATMELVGEAVSVGQLVELYDTPGSIGVYVIQQVERQMGAAEKTVAKLEHAICLLGDTIIPGYYEFGGVGTTTTSVLQALLAKQRVQNWVLGTCDFTYSYQYSVENEYLYNAIMSVATPFPTAYQWHMDTSGYPYVLSLKAAPDTATMELRETRGVQSIKHRIDRTDMRTRLYPRGYGEGVNQLTIRDVNGGVEYIEKNTAAFGVVEDIYPETTITDAATLMAAAQAVLDRCSEPRAMCEITGEDVYALTGEPLDRWRLGVLARVALPGYGMSLLERVIELKKSDVYGPNPRPTLLLSNQKSDLASEAAKLMNKARNAELYSQGSTCLFALTFGDNCDADSPLEVQIPIDRNVVNINMVQIKYKVSAFRAYSKAATSGGGGSQTSEGGGSVTITEPQRIRSTTAMTGGPLDMLNGAAITSTDVSSIDLMTEMGGDGSTGSSSGSTAAATCSHKHEYVHYHKNTTTTLTGAPVNQNAQAKIFTETSDTTTSHSHGLNGHKHSLPEHQHSVTQHRHPFGHYHSVHVSITLPALDFIIPHHTHNVTWGTHTHGIEYGIYKGTRADTVTVSIDETAVPAAIAESRDFDAAPYLGKDENGRITRGWHKLSFCPDKMTRIEGTIYVKTFVTAFDGGRF